MLPPFMSFHVFKAPVSPIAGLTQTVVADAHAGNTSAASKPMTTRMIAPRRSRRSTDEPIETWRGVCCDSGVCSGVGCGDDVSRRNERRDEQNDTAIP
ncbi:MAG TPA: hypothetical protein VFL07_10035 [Rudaea sp.]|nr:hypothetical protein [Rudaea sp.]HSC11768.1 hypothetical protein [Rhodanobacteraceae bacterium]